MKVIALICLIILTLCVVAGTIALGMGMISEALLNYEEYKEKYGRE